MKFKHVYILDIIVIVFLIYFMPRFFYEQNINSPCLMIFASLLIFILYLYIYRIDPDRNVYRKLIDYLNYLSEDISAELQELYIVFYKETDCFPIIKQNTDLSFNIDIYYNETNIGLDKITKDIAAVSFEFAYIINHYIEVYNEILCFVDYKEHCETKLKQSKQFFKSKFYDDCFFKDKSFFKYPEIFINKLMFIEKSKDKTASIKEKSYISTLFNKNKSLIFGRFIYFNVYYPGYHGLYIKYDNKYSHEIKVIDEYRYEYTEK